MVYPHNTFDAETAKAWVGEGGMKQYFKVIPKPKPPKPRGRPPKRKARSTNKPPTEFNSAAPVPAPVAALETAEGAAPAVARFVDIENEQKKKKSRTNWGTGEHRIKLDKALNDWSKKEGDIFDDNGEMIDNWRVFANKVDIPADTFYKYIKPNNPRQVGDGSRGKKRLMTTDEIKFTGCILARQDRVNDGLSTKEALDLVQEMIPDITRKAARNAMYRNILPLNHALGVLKRTTQKVQATTTDRTNINIPQQYRWHKVVDEVYNYLRTNNTGMCQKSGKTFGEVMPHFLIGLDEMCLMSDSHGDLRVVASADKKKQEKLLQDSRCSITVVRTGTMAGTTGPTYFLLKGTKCKKNFNDDYLVRYGMQPGSAIIMTENAYMTDEAWLQLSKKIVEGYRLLPYIKENPMWHVCELLDGFKSHENVLEAHELRANALIISLKEESNSSHVNQGYDQLVAKTDKKNAAESLYDQRKAKKFSTGKTNITQYDLLITAMRIVRATSEETWVHSFQRVNLHPFTRMEFPEFCRKIASHLRAGDIFKNDNVDTTAEEKFALLPTFWHGMTPAERKVVMTVCETHAYQYSVACITTLHVECKLMYSQMNDVRVCVLVARDHPESLDFNINELTVASVAVPQAVSEENARKISLNDNLYHLMRIPRDGEGNPIIVGNDLFDHMCRFRNMKHAAEDHDNDEVPRMAPSEALDINLFKDSLMMIQPTEYDLRRGAILKDYAGNNAKRRTAKRKLNNIAVTIGNCCVVNSEENMRRQREQLIMADSVAEISRMEAEEKAVEKRAKNKVHDENAPAAAAKLEKNSRVVSMLTVKEIKAILFKVYNIILGSTRKPDCIKALESQMGSNIDKYNDYLRLLAADNAALADDNAAVVPPALATIEDVRTAESEEEVEEPVSNAIDDDTLEDREEMEVDEDSAYDMDGGVLEADDADYDFGDQDANEHDTNLIDANVMNNDEPEGRIRSIRRKVLPARLKECMF